MIPSDQDPLLREILGAAETASFRAASLAQGLAVMRQRKRRQRLAQTCAAVMAPALLAMALVLHYSVKLPAAPLASIEIRDAVERVPTPAPPIRAPRRRQSQNHHR